MHTFFFLSWEFLGEKKMFSSLAPEKANEVDLSAFLKILLIFLLFSNYQNLSYILFKIAFAYYYSDIIY